MEFINHNDYIRNNLSKKLNVDEYDNAVKELYNEFILDRKKYLNIIEVMALTSYAINYLSLEKFYDDEEIIKQIKFFDSIKNTNQLLDSLDENTFKIFCNDILLFTSLDNYSKKRFILSLLNINDILNKFPSYINDVLKYNKKYDSNIIFNEYNRILLECNDKNKAYKNTINFAIEFLIRLQEEDLENYNEIFNNIINDVYYYDKYLIDKNKNIDDSSKDLFNMIHDEPEELIYFSMNNVSFLKSILKDYLSFCSFSKESKNVFDDYKKTVTNFFGYKAYEVLNINNLIRKYLFSVFEDDDFYNKDCSKIINLIRQSDVFDMVADVLYNDIMTLKCYDDLTALEEDKDDELDYLKGLYDIEEFKENLLDDEDMFLNIIYYSIEYYLMGMPEKREMLEKLLKNNMYDYFLNKNYILDVLDYKRKYELSDACSFYYEALEEEKDKKISIAQATDLLCDDLIMLYSYNEDEYRDIFYKISELFYKTFKYKQFIGKNVLDEEVSVVSLMESDFDKYLKDSSNNLSMREIVINGFYEFVSLNDVQRQNIIDYYNDLEGKHKLKNFTKK